MFEFVSPECYKLQYWGSKCSNLQKKKKVQRKLTPFQELIITLMRLRTGLLVQDLVYRLNILCRLISNIFVTWILFLYDYFNIHLHPSMFPSQQHISQTLPKIFKSLKGIMIIVDCAEFFCQSPNNFEHQGNLYSQYKAHTTFKVLIGCTPNGAISFVSEVYEGSISDREIFIRSKLVDLFEPGDLILADRGFNIHDIVQSKGAVLNIPPFLHGRQRLTAQEEILTKRIAKQRIYVEHAIDRLKQMRLLQKTLPLSMRGMISQLVFVAACLVNFQEPIVLDE